MIVPIFLPHLGCGQRCAYCNQETIVGSIQGALTGARIAASLAAIDGPVEAALYGGNILGLEPEGLAGLLRLFEPYREKISHLRISAKPGPVNQEVIGILKEHRVRVIELGIPTTNNRILSLLGRGHTAGDFFDAFRFLKDEGFEVGMQVMVGLPKEKAADLRETVSAIIACAPRFIRIYPLVVIRDTPLFDSFRAGEYAPDSMEEAVAKACFVYASAWKHGIRTIKMGLTENEVLREKIAAGPFHPAFGYLVKSEAFRLAVMRVCEASAVRGEVAVSVNEGDIPHLIGFKRANISSFRKKGISITWAVDARMDKGYFTIDGRGRKASGSLADAPAMIPS